MATTLRPSNREHQTCSKPAASNFSVPESLASSVPLDQQRSQPQPHNSSQSTQQQTKLPTRSSQKSRGSSSSEKSKKHAGREWEGAHIAAAASQSSHKKPEGAKAASGGRRGGIYEHANKLTEPHSLQNSSTAIGLGANHQSSKSKPASNDVKAEAKFPKAARTTLDLQALLRQLNEGQITPAGFLTRLAVIKD